MKKQIFKMKILRNSLIFCLMLFFSHVSIASSQVVKVSVNLNNVTKNEIIDPLVKSVLKIGHKNFRVVCNLRIDVRVRRRNILVFEQKMTAPDNMIRNGLENQTRIHSAI